MKVAKIKAAPLLLPLPCHRQCVLCSWSMLVHICVAWVKDGVLYTLSCWFWWSCDMSLGSIPVLAKRAVANIYVSDSLYACQCVSLLVCFVIVSWWMLVLQMIDSVYTNVCLSLEKLPLLAVSLKAGSWIKAQPTAVHWSYIALLNRRATPSCTTALDNTQHCCTVWTLLCIHLLWMFIQCVQ